MQEQVSFDPVMIDSPEATWGLAFMVWLLPCALSIFFCRSSVHGWLQSRSDQFNWTRLRWQFPLAGLAPALLMFLVGESHPLLLGFLAVLDLPGLIPIFLFWWLTQVSGLPQIAVWVLLAASHFGGWYCLIRLAELASRRPTSIRAEIDRA